MCQNKSNKCSHKANLCDWVMKAEKDLMAGIIMAGRIACYDNMWFG